MTYEMSSHPAIIKEFHFYRLIDRVSLDMMFEIEASVHNAVIDCKYDVVPFRIHIIPL